MTQTITRKEIKLLFTPENRQKAIAGIKIQTRRTITPLCDRPAVYDYQESSPYPYCFRRKDAAWHCFRTIDELAAKYCPYGSKGDLLYLLEPTQIVSLNINHTRQHGRKIVSAIVRYDDGVEIEQIITEPDINRLIARKDWRKKTTCLFMLKSFARHWFRNDGVRVERLQDISEQDAIAEGVVQLSSGFWSSGIGSVEGTIKLHPNPVSAFAELWNSINADRGFGWDANPMVWVISFSKFEEEDDRT